MKHPFVGMLLARNNTRGITHLSTSTSSSTRRWLTCCHRTSSSSSTDICVGPCFSAAIGSCCCVSCCIWFPHPGSCYSAAALAISYSHTTLAPYILLNIYYNYGAGVQRCDRQPYVRRDTRLTVSRCYYRIKRQNACYHRMQWRAAPRIMF